MDTTLYVLSIFSAIGMGWNLKGDTKTNRMMCGIFGGALGCLTIEIIF